MKAADQKHDGWLAGPLPDVNSAQQDSHQFWTLWRWFVGSAAKQSTSSAEKIIRSFIAASDKKQTQKAFKARSTHPM